MMFQIRIKLLFSELFYSEGTVVKLKGFFPDGILHAFGFGFFFLHFSLK